MKTIKSSAVISAVQTQDTETARSLYLHFKKIDRSDQFKSYYIKTTRSQMKIIWEEKDEKDRILTIYEEIKNKLKNHITFIKAVFDTEESGYGNILLELYSSVLNHLPVKETIKNLTIEDEPEESFITLGSIRLMSSNFMNTVKDTLRMVSKMTPLSYSFDRLAS